MLATYFGDLGSRGFYQLFQHKYMYIYIHIIYIYAVFFCFFFVTDNELQKIPTEAASLREMIVFRQLHQRFRK